MHEHVVGSGAPLPGASGEGRQGPGTGQRPVPGEAEIHRMRTASAITTYPSVVHRDSWILFHPAEKL